MSDSSFFSRFNTPAHIEWKRDRALRHRVPLSETWRGCVGLAALLRNVENSCNHGDACLHATEDVTWMCLRDVPPGHFPGSPVMNRRDVNYVNLATATLRHGQPVIDFTAAARTAWDFKFCPFDSYTRPVGPGKRGLEWVEACGDVLHSTRYSREFQ